LLEKASKGRHGSRLFLSANSDGRSMLRTLLQPKKRVPEAGSAQSLSPGERRDQLQAQFPDASAEELGLILATEPTTMTSPERIIGLVRAVDYIVRAKVPGDLVECGVWRGGSMFAAAQALLNRGCTDRQLWLYDTFEGMSPPTTADIDLHGKTAAGLLQLHNPQDRRGVWCLSRREEVEQTMVESGYPTDRTRFVAGKVEETLPVTRPGAIALLRLDTDWYESTRCELEHLFPLLSPGGILIVDDYGHWQGCRRAVDDYFDSTGQIIHLARMDYTGRIGIKTVNHFPSA
jgi:O-methyltransferase